MALTKHENIIGRSGLWDGLLRLSLTTPFGIFQFVGLPK